MQCICSLIKSDIIISIRSWNDKPEDIAYNDQLNTISSLYQLWDKLNLDISYKDRGDSTDNS